MAEAHASPGARPAVRAAATGLLCHASGDANDVVIARMVGAWSGGAGVLGRWMGLTPGMYRRMVLHHFPGAAPAHGKRLDAKPPLDRLEEREDLYRLLMAHRANRSRSESWVAELVVASCMGGGHLWRDMGLWSRADLSALLERNFPTLARRNTQNMKWKKFLYKQLCMAEGIYICRAPSCEVCTDYAICFGPED